MPQPLSADRSGRSPSGGSPSAASPRGAPRDDTWSEPRVATPSASSPSSRYASRSVPQASASGPIKALKQGAMSSGKSINILVHVKCDKEETRGVSGTIELSSTIAPDRVEIPTLTGVGAKRLARTVTAQQLRGNIEGGLVPELDAGGPVAGTDATVWIQLLALDAEKKPFAQSDVHVLQERLSQMMLTGTHPVEWSIELEGIDEDDLRKCYNTPGYAVRCIIGHENDGEDMMTSAWQLSEVVVTYIQHDAQLGKGEHAELTHASDTNIQWHFLPPHENHWIGHMEPGCRCDGKEYEIEAKKLQIDMLQQQIAELENEVADLEQTVETNKARCRDFDRSGCRGIGPNGSLDRQALGECPRCRLVIDDDGGTKQQAAGQTPDKNGPEAWWKIAAAALSCCILLILIIAIASSGADDEEIAVTTTVAAPVIAVTEARLCGEAGQCIIFDEFDTDGNAVLLMDELRTGFLAAGDGLTVEQEADFLVAVADGISFAEFEAICPDCNPLCSDGYTDVTTHCPAGGVGVELAGGAVRCAAEACTAAECCLEVDACLAAPACAPATTTITFATACADLPAPAVGTAYTCVVQSTCVDPGTVCAAGVTGACPAGCSDDGATCSGTADCALGVGGEEVDCDTAAGCLYVPGA